MATIVVVGARSQLGRQIAARLRADGHTLRLIASDIAKEPLETLADQHVEGVTASSFDRCVQALTGADMLVIAATPDRPMWVGAAVKCQCPLVDCASEQHEIAGVFDELAQLPCVLGAGLAPGIPDLLVNATLDRITPAVTAVTTAFSWPDRNFPPASLKGSVGRRRAIAGTLTNPGMRLVDGRGVVEEIGERRQPVWFPRPVGSQFALAWPSVSWFTLPERINGLHTSEHFVVVGGWRSEVLQALSNLARRQRGARWLEQRATRPVASIDSSRLRWACVTELHTEKLFWRAWAYGHDPYLVSAAMVGKAVTALTNGEVSDRQSFASLPNPETVLDDLTQACGLRWTVSEAIERRLT
ncbi:MAG: hypothetical protein WD360_07245 [Nitriliruptoraceae bacterium]